jgi:hypothetical protein
LHVPSQPALRKKRKEKKRKEKKETKKFFLEFARKRLENSVKNNPNKIEYARRRRNS